MNNQLPKQLDSFLRLFAQQSKQPSQVSWVKNYTDQKQIFVSEQFEDVFAISCDKIYDRPEIWWEFIIDDNLNHIQKVTSSRTASPQSTDAQTPIFYRINSADGHQYFLRDVSFPLYNQQGDVYALAGFSEVLDPVTWENLGKEYHDNELEKLNTTTILLTEKLTQANLDFVNKNKKPGKKQAKIVREIQINGLIVKLTQRESEVLYHLTLGKTAKETGSDLFLSPRTVETHLDNIRQKTYCKNKLELFHLVSGLDVEQLLDNK